jgi:PhnB protein
MSDAESRTAAAAEIKAVIEDWAEAMRRKDASRVLAHGTEDAIIFSLAPPLKASDSDPDGLEQWFSTWKGPLGFTFQDLDISPSGDVAFATALAHLSGEKNDGQKPALWYRLTLGTTHSRNSAILGSRRKALYCTSSSTMPTSGGSARWRRARK